MDLKRATGIRFLKRVKLQNSSVVYVAIVRAINMTYMQRIACKAYIQMHLN